MRFIIFESDLVNEVSDILTLMVSAGTRPGTVDLSLTFQSDGEIPLTYIPNPTIDERIPEFGTFQTIYSGGSGDLTLHISFASNASPFAPEPATLALLGLGLAGLGFSRRRNST